MASGRNGRDIRLDVIRSVAILLVILIHAFEMCYGSAPWKEGGVGSLSFSLAFWLGRLGVPMFFMLTGYLVLSKDYSDDEAVRNFYRRSWSSLLTTILLWTTVYCAVYVFSGRSSPIDAAKYMLLLENVPAGLWWFVSAIVSLYVAVPFVSRALDGLQPRTLLVPAAFVLAYGFFVPTYNNCVAPLIGWGGCRLRLMRAIFSDRMGPTWSSATVLGDGVGKDGFSFALPFRLP